MKRGRKIECPYTALLIPEEGTSKLLPNAFHTTEDASSTGERRARELFPGQRVELVVIKTMTREAVANYFVHPTGGSQ